MTDDEAQGLAMIAGRLRERFPTVPPDTVDAVVADLHREYDGHPIRDFVPLLVEREARDHLRATVPPQRTAPEDGDGDALRAPA